MLFSEFPSITAAEWRAQALKDLKGKTLEDLIYRPESAIEAQAFYTADDVPNDLPVLARAEGNEWAMNEFITVSDATAANTQALTALAGGSSALTFEANWNTVDLATLFQDIRLDYIQVHLEGNDINSLVPKFVSYCQAQNYDLSSLQGSIAIQSLNGITELPQFKTAVIDALGYFNKTSADQLYAVISEAKTYLDDADTTQTLSAEKANRLVFKLPIGTKYFVEISKLRALSQLWLNLLDAYDLPTSLPIIQAYTVNPNPEQTHSNMIAAATQSLSAVIGGANLLTVLPADGGAGTPFTRRIARNVQHLLREESGMQRVGDAAAGAYYIENITMQLAENVWSRLSNV